MRNYRLATTRKGFTLVEAIVALGINSIVVIMAVRMCTTCYVLQSDCSMHNATDSQARIVSSLVSNDLRSAMEIKSTFTAEGTTYVSGDHTLIISLPPVDAHGNAITGTADRDHVVYHQGNSRRVWRSFYPSSSSSLAREDKVLGPLDAPSISIVGSYAQQPDALGCYLVTYSITCKKSAWRTHGHGDRFASTVDGTIRLRNRPV
jgi:hypothetical protein